MPQPAIVVDDRDDVPAAVADHPVRSLRGPVGEETGGQDGEPFAHARLTKACSTITTRPRAHGTSKAEVVY
jgi:hypothetical protein